MSAVASPGQLLVFAKTMNGKILRARAKPSDTVTQLKDAFRRENPQYLPMSTSFRLISRAKNLADQKTLAELQISNQQMLQLVDIERSLNSIPSSPSNEPANNNGKVEHSTSAAAKVVEPTEAAVPPPKHTQQAAPTVAPAKPAPFLPGESFHKVVRTAAKVLPDGQEGLARQGSMRASNSVAAASGAGNHNPVAGATSASRKNILQDGMLGESFHKIVRTASKILPKDDPALLGASSGAGGSPTVAPNAPVDATALNGFQRAAPLDNHPPINENEEVGEWSGEEEAQGSKRTNGDVDSAPGEGEGREEEDVFQTAMAALGHVVVVMEGVKTTVDAAAKKLETLEAHVERLNAVRPDMDRLSQRVASAEARAREGPSSANETLIKNIAERLARLERSP